MKRRRGNMAMTQQMYEVQKAIEEIDQQESQLIKALVVLIEKKVKLRMSTTKGRYKTCIGWVDDATPCHRQGLGPRVGYLCEEHKKFHKTPGTKKWTDTYIDWRAKNQKSGRV